MNFAEAKSAFQSHRGRFEQIGICWHDGAPAPVAYLPEEFKSNYAMAMDAVPALTTTANAGIPSFLSLFVDPERYQILFAANEAANIFGEVRKGDWTTETAMFPVVEHTGEVSSYGDYNENGAAGANTGWPQRQAYRFQTIEEYGDLEIERAGLGRLNWVGEVEGAAADVMAKYANFTYCFGVQGLQNYGSTNDPNLSAAITPALKAYGGTAWISGGLIRATANEIYADITSLFSRLVAQNPTLVTAKTKMTLALDPTSSTALTATNSFNVNVEDLLKKNFPALEVKTIAQYGVLSSTNPQGIAGGNLMQLIADSVEGQKTADCAFTEKMRAFPIIRKESSYRKKVMGGTYGTIIRQPSGIAQMLGI